MEIAIPTKQPFSFRQSLAFDCRFAPLETATIVDAERIVAAFAADGRGWACELRDGLRVRLADDAPITLARRMADLVGAQDDLAPFYARAAEDPAMVPVIEQ